MLILALLVCLLMFAAGCSSKSGSAPMPSDAHIPSYSDSSDHSFSGGTLPVEAPADGSGNVFTGRKVIRNASLTVQTLEFDAFMNGITERINAFGGYIESNSVDQRSYYSNGSLRSAAMVVRIPAERLDDFLREVDGLGNITRREEYVNDVTDQYTDVEARLASLRTEYEALLGLLSRAETLDDILRLQSRLTEVRGQIESLERQLRSYDSQIDYSKVSLDVCEVLRATAVEPETFGQEVSRRFKESLEDVGGALSDFAKWLLGESPRILLVLLIFVFPPIIVLICVRRARKRARSGEGSSRRRARTQRNAAPEAPKAGNEGQGAKEN